MRYSETDTINKVKKNGNIIQWVIHINSQILNCPKVHNCVISLVYRHIISLEAIQIQEKCYCTCEINQSDGQTIYERCLAIYLI